MLDVDDAAFALKVDEAVVDVEEAAPLVDDTALEDEVAAGAMDDDVDGGGDEIAAAGVLQA